MSLNEAETRYHLIDPVLRDKGYMIPYIKLETPSPVEPTGPKGRRRRGAGRTDYLLCVQVADMPNPLSVGVLEAKKEAEDPFKGMQQAKGYADCNRFEVKYVFSTNGHLYGEFDLFTNLQSGPFPFKDFPPHPDLTTRYAKDTGIDVTKPEAAILFQADSPAWSQTRYYQDAAIRATFEKIIHCQQTNTPARVLLALATGSGKTIIATNLLWRLSQVGQLPKPALFLCDRDELREQAYTKLKAAFGDNVRIVKTERGGNAAQNARIHIATYQTLGLDDEEEDFGSFLTEHYGENAFSVIIIDECHRSAWGRWSEVLKRNPDAIHIGLTATPRQLHESKKATAEDLEITANNHKYFGKPVYEYTLIEAQEDGYLAACEIVKRKASIDKVVFTRKEILSGGVKDIRTGRLLTEEDLTRETYTGKDFDDELFIELRTPKMCEDLFKLLCENGGPEQKMIIFCNREIHADRVAMHMNNLYTQWCQKQGQTPKDHYAFKCMGGPNNGADMIEPMRGSGERAFIACTVDLLEAGVDIERLNGVVFFRYLQSPIKFYQMVGRGTRIHEETEKYKFWLYDYTDVTSLFGTDFITKPPRPSGSKGGGGDDTSGGGEDSEGPSVGMIGGQAVVIKPEGRYILSRGADGKETPIPVDEYRREVIQRVVSEAHNLDDFRELWIETQKRQKLIEHLLGDNFSPDVIREIDQMQDFDLYDFFGHHGYHARALQYVPELTWILFLRILDAQEAKEREEAEVVGANFSPALASPYRWQDWAAPYSEDEDHLQTDAGKPFGWKRQELFAAGDGKLFDFINNELLPHLHELDIDARTGMPNGSASRKQRIIGRIMTAVERVRVDSETNLRDILDKVDEISIAHVDDTHFFTLSQVYEDLLLKMGEKNSDGGQFFTPREVIRAMIHTINPEPGKTIYDPGCGTGGFLAIAYEHIARKLGNSPASTDIDTLKYDTFFGREKENLVFPIALANLVLHGIDQPNLWHGNTLTRRATYAALFEQAPRVFDYIFTNPPFGGKEGKDAQKNFAFETGSTQVLFLQDILSELGPQGTCAIVLDEGLLFRTNESAFVETKRKLVDECNLWAIISLPGGVFSTAGAGVKTNLLFFTKGQKTEKIWYYDLTHIKVGKKTPLTLAHFGFDSDGELLADDKLPANLTAPWHEDEDNDNNGKPFPSYARMLGQRGKTEGESRYSWTIDFTARRTKAREEMQPLLDKAAGIKGTVIELKEQLKRLKKEKAGKEAIADLTTEIKEKEKSARDLESNAADIDAAVFDLKAVNPNAIVKVDTRTPIEVIDNIEKQGMIVSTALSKLKQLLVEAE